MSIRNESLAAAGDRALSDDLPANDTPARGGARAAARQTVVQALYQWRMANGDADTIAREFADAGRLGDTERDFFNSTLRGVVNEAGELEQTFDRFLDRPASQLDPVEYVILLLATFELKYRPEIPFAAVIDQATGLARTFGATDGHRFVNAVADRLARELRPNDPPRRG